MWATGHTWNMENSAETLRIRILATDDLTKQPRWGCVLHYRLYSRMNTVNIRSFHAALGFLQAHQDLTGKMSTLHAADVQRLKLRCHHLSAGAYTRPVCRLSTLPQ